MKTAANTPTTTPDRSRLLGTLWFGLLCAAVFFAPWLGGQLSGVGPAVARALVAGAGLAWTADRWGQWELPRPAAWLWLFIGWSVVTALQGTYMHASLLALSDLVTYATIATLAADAARDERRRDTLTVSLLVSLGIVACVGVWHAVQSGPGWREFGPSTTPNLFACYLVTTVPLALLVTFSPAGWRKAKKEAEPATPFPEWSGLLTSYGERVGAGSRLVAFTALFIVSAAIALAATSVLLMTGSKGAILALVLGCVVAFLAGRVFRFFRWDVLTSLVLLLLAANALGGRTLFGRVEAAGGAEAHSTQFRILTWKGTARMAAAHPVLGTGVGTFPAAFSKYAIAGWTQAAHDAYLQTLAETGVVGLVLFLVALGSAALWLYRAARSGDRTRSLLAAGALAGLLAAAMHNVVDYGWVPWAPPAVLWALIGLGVGEGSRRSMPKWAAVGALVPLALTLAGGILIANAASLAEPATDPYVNMPLDQKLSALRSARGLDPLDAKLATDLGFAEAQAGNHEMALYQFVKAVHLSWNDWNAWRFLGEAYMASNQTDQAREAFQHGLEAAPHSYKLLEDAAHLEEATGHPDRALTYDRLIIATAEGPVGKYPAVPEIVDIEPIRAYAAVAADEQRRGDVADARRHWQALIALADRFEQNRTKYSVLWKANQKDDPARLAEVQSLRAEAERALAKLP